MAWYRQIYTTFWSDAKVADDFTPEDKYFYLYLLTNSHTTLCGCYEISEKQISNDTGYTVDVVARLLDRLENVHHVILRDRDTKEILILNWYKYNWNRSEKVMRGVLKETDKIKSPVFRDKVMELMEAF
jgi:transcription initiation factor IIE alpha subunit